MEELKTAEEVRKEIIKEYFTLGEKDLTGRAPFCGLGEECYDKKQCMDVITSKKEVLKKIVGFYFKPTEDGKYMDETGNVYEDELEAFELGIMYDLYNTPKPKSRKPRKIIEEANTYG